jgi:excisionase family DNA binding protein
MSKKMNSTPAVPLPPLLTIQEAAAATGFNEKTIRRRISENTLVAYRVGPRAIRVDRDSLMALLRPLGAV